jgi:hypothetical protein
MKNKSIAEELKDIKKAKKAAARKPFIDSLHNNWRTVKIIVVVLFFVSVIAMGVAGAYFGLVRIDVAFWRYIVTFCGTTTTLTGLGAMMKCVEKVSK